MGCLVFDGIDDRLETTLEVLLPSYPFTLAAWAIPFDTSHRGTLVSVADQLRADSYMNIEANGVDFGVPAAVARHTSIQRANGTTIYDEFSWGSFTGVFLDGSNRSAFWNGGNKGSNGASAGGGVYTLNKIAVGREADSAPGAYYKGSLQYVFLWDIDLSDADVLSWHQGNMVQEANIWDWWEFTGGATEVGKVQGTVLNTSGAVYGSLDTPPVTYGGGAPSDPWHGRGVVT